VIKLASISLKVFVSCFQQKHSHISLRAELFTVRVAGENISKRSLFAYIYIYWRLECYM